MSGKAGRIKIKSVFELNHGLRRKWTMFMFDNYSLAPRYFYSCEKTAETDKAVKRILVIH